MYPSKWAHLDNEISQNLYFQKLTHSTYHFLTPFGPLPDKNGAFMIKEGVVSVDLIPEITAKKILTAYGYDYEQLKKCRKLNLTIAILMFDEMLTYQDTITFNTLESALDCIKKKIESENIDG